MKIEPNLLEIETGTMQMRIFLELVLMPLSYRTYCARWRYMILNHTDLNHSNWPDKTNVKILIFHASTSVHKITNGVEEIL